jgi:hypothetical protein
MSTILLTNIIPCFDMFSKHFQWNKQLHLSNLYCINSVKTTMEPIDGRTRCIKELGIKILSFYLRFRSIQMVRETESENGNLKNCLPAIQMVRETVDRFRWFRSIQTVVCYLQTESSDPSESGSESWVGELSESEIELSAADWEWEWEWQLCGRLRVRGGSVYAFFL